MGEVRTEVTLVNIRDAGNAQSGFIPESGIRQLTVSSVVDTGAGTLVINEETREKLGLRIEETWRKPMAFASEFATQTDMMCPLSIAFKQKSSKYFSSYISK